MSIASGKDSFKSQLGPVAIEFTIVNKQELDLSWIEESCSPPTNKFSREYNPGSPDPFSHPREQLWFKSAKNSTPLYNPLSAHCKR
jgi:hypothetical protein